MSVTREHVSNTSMFAIYTVHTLTGLQQYYLTRTINTINSEEISRSFKNVLNDIHSQEMKTWSLLMGDE
jgi:hypothetical protein